MNRIEVHIGDWRQAFLRDGDRWAIEGADEVCAEVLAGFEAAAIPRSSRYSSAEIVQLLGRAFFKAAAQKENR